ncbi:MAG: hypothetical protein ACLGIJ_06150 [Candidatus Limnocylindria bacterium]
MHTRPARLIQLLASLAVAGAITACSPTTPTAVPSASVSGAPGDPATSDEPAGSPTTTQTDTEWGRIWDDLPAGFPVAPGGTVADDASPEPVTATLAYPTGEPAGIASWMQAALETATYSTEALSGPFEDGSLVLDSVGDGGCRIQTVVAPAGGLILMTIRYGAACPNP